jgi:regulation of enolase protein 1 (concanavalin A-like superfamily)
MRARWEDGPWQMIRLAYLAADDVAVAGPGSCSPLRAAFWVRFTRLTIAAADASLH